MEARQENAVTAKPIESALAVVRDTLPRLKKMKEGAICDLMLWAATLEFAAFLLRGACALELKRRADRFSRQPGTGVKQTLRDYARDMGVALRTLERDIQIVQTFFVDEDGNFKTDVAGDTLLPRKYYEIALPAADPVQALALARNGIGMALASKTRSYTTAKFENDLKAQNLLPAVRSSFTPEQSDYAAVRICGRAHQALQDLCDRLHLTAEEVIEALLEQAREMGPGTRAVFLPQAAYRDIQDEAERFNASRSGQEEHLSVAAYLEHNFQQGGDRVFLAAPRRRGVKGVGFDRRAARWRARVWESGKQISLGYFASEEEAMRAVTEPGLQTNDVAA